MIFFEVAGGPYGAEPVVRKGDVDGYGMIWRFSVESTGELSLGR